MASAMALSPVLGDVDHDLLFMTEDNVEVRNNARKTMASVVNFAYKSSGIAPAQVACSS